MVRYRDANVPDQVELEAMEKATIARAWQGFLEAGCHIGLSIIVLPDMRSVLMPMIDDKASFFMGVMVVCQDSRAVMHIHISEAWTVEDVDGKKLAEVLASGKGVAGRSGKEEILFVSVESVYATRSVYRPILRLGGKPVLGKAVVSTEESHKSDGRMLGMIQKSVRMN